MQPYALRAPEVILGLGWGSAIDIWSLGCMVLTFPLTCPYRVLLTTFSPKMFEFATGHWLFDPKDVDDISRDVVHLAQMTQRTGQDHDDAVLKQYEIREKQHNIKGRGMHFNVLQFILPSLLQEC